NLSSPCLLNGHHHLQYLLVSQRPVGSKDYFTVRFLLQQRRHPRLHLRQGNRLVVEKQSIGRIERDCNGVLRRRGTGGSPGQVQADRRGGEGHAQQEGHEQLQKG